MTEKTIWRVIDSHWRNIERVFVSDDNETSTQVYSGTLADYFYSINMDIPDYVSYCLAQNNLCKIKFRQSGGQIEIFAESL